MWVPRRWRRSEDYDVEVVWLADIPLEPQTCPDVGLKCQPRGVKTRTGVILQCPVCDTVMGDVEDKSVMTREVRRLLRMFK